MEPNSPADEPPPETAPELPIESAAPPPAEAAGATDAPEAIAPEPATAEPAAADELGQLAEASARARLSPAEEERLTIVLKEALLGGRAGVARAVEVLPGVPWIVGVRAVEQAWPELTAGFRTQLLAGIAKDDSDTA